MAIALMISTQASADAPVRPAERLCRCTQAPDADGCPALIERVPAAELPRHAADCSAPARGGPTLCQCLTREAPDPETARRCQGMLSILEAPAIRLADSRCRAPLKD